MTQEEKFALEQLENIVEWLSTGKLSMTAENKAEARRLFRRAFPEHDLNKILEWGTKFLAIPGWDEA